MLILKLNLRNFIWNILNIQHFSWNYCHISKWLRIVWYTLESLKTKQRPAEHKCARFACVGRKGKNYFINILTWFSCWKNCIHVAFIIIVLYQKLLIKLLPFSFKTQVWFQHYKWKNYITDAAELQKICSIRIKME